MARCGLPPTEPRGNFSEVLFTATQVWVRALESSAAEILHDLARNSIDSVGVSGGGQVAGSQLAGLSSCMFSSLFSELWEPHTVAGDTATKSQETRLVTVFLVWIYLNQSLLGLNAYFVGVLTA